MTSTDESAFLSVPLFHDVPPADLVRMVNELPIETFEPGSYLFRDGDPGDNLYVVRDGHLEVLLAEGSPDEMLLKICGPGEYVGEMGLILADGKRTATVRAKDHVQTWVMNRAKFTEVLHRWPFIAYGMVNILSERLDATNDATFRDLTAKNHTLQQRAAELAIINSVQEGLASKLDYQAIIELVGETIRTLFHSDNMSIRLYNRSTDTVSYPFWVDAGKRENFAPRPLGTGLTAHIIQTKQALVINQDLEQRVAELEGYWIGSDDVGRDRSFVGIPILTGNEAVGAVALGSKQQNAFSDSDVRLLQTLTNSMGVALENARLFKETEQRAAELATINSVQTALASKLETQAIYDLVGDKMGEIFHADTVHIDIYDNAAQVDPGVPDA